MPFLNSPEERGEKVMLNIMGALWFSIEISGVIGQRLYFRPSQLIQMAQISNFDGMFTSGLVF